VELPRAFLFQSPSELAVIGRQETVIKTSSAKKRSSRSSSADIFAAAATQHGEHAQFGEVAMGSVQRCPLLVWSNV
jgi:hypothetical protein